jgi:hypothetical protein
MPDSDAASLVRIALQREESTLCAFCEASRGERTALDAIAEVLAIGEDGMAHLASFLETSTFGSLALCSFNDFVACINAYATLRPKPRTVNLALLRAAGKWKMHLQKVRANMAFVYSNDGPDDISAFPQAIADGFASESRFKRQSSRMSISPEPRYSQISRTSSAASQARSSLRKQHTQTFAKRITSANMSTWEEAEDEDDEDGQPVSRTSTFRRGSWDADEAEASFTEPAHKATAWDAPSARRALESSPLERRGTVFPLEAPGDASDNDSFSSPLLSPGGVRVAESEESVRSFKSEAEQLKAADMVRSVEMGMEDDGAMPLPTAICGTFSCHGMDEDVGKVCARASFRRPLSPLSPPPSLPICVCDPFLDFVPRAIADKPRLRLPRLPAQEG